MHIYVLACLCLVAVGYILGANELLEIFNLSLLLSIVTGIISSVLVSLFFIHRERKAHARVVAPKLNKLLTVFRHYYSDYMLTPHIKRDIVGYIGDHEDAFNYPPNKKDICFRQLYERSRYTGLRHINNYGTEHDKAGHLRGLEERPHLDAFLYVTNIQIRELLLEVERYSYCLDENILSIFFHIQNSPYLCLYDNYSNPTDGTWEQMIELYSDIEKHGEGAILPPKYIKGVMYSPSYIRDSKFELIDHYFVEVFESFHQLQKAYDIMSEDYL